MCDYCDNHKELKSCNFCGAATMRLVGDTIEVFGDETKFRIFRRVYWPRFAVKYWPDVRKEVKSEGVIPWEPQHHLTSARSVKRKARRTGASVSHGFPAGMCRVHSLVAEQGRAARNAFKNPGLIPGF